MQQKPRPRRPAQISLTLDCPPPLPASLARPVAGPEDFPDFTVWSPALARRGGVSYITLRAWRPVAIRRALELFKRVKYERHAGVTDFAAGEVADFVAALLAPGPGWSIVNIACGHSQRRDCFGKRLAQRTAERLSLPMLQVFDDRLRRGSSHPRQNASLPPLDTIAAAAGPCILVDDLATSGFHLEEAATAIRQAGHACIAIAWLARAR